MSQARSNSRGICHEIARNEAGEEISISHKSTSSSNKVFLASNGKRYFKFDRVTSYSFDGWIYNIKALTCFCSFYTWPLWYDMNVPPSSLYSRV